MKTNVSIAARVGKIYANSDLALAANQMRSMGFNPAKDAAMSECFYSLVANNLGYSTATEVDAADFLSMEIER